MKIFVTGASGFIGKSFIQKLLKDELIETIYCLCRSDLYFEHPKIVHIKKDINNIKDFKINDKIDAFVHFAAYLKNESAKEFEKVNVQGTISAVKFCKNNNINKIIYCSTINVKLKRKGGYATSKLKAEEIILNSRLDYIIVRPTLVYGIEDNGLNKMLQSAKKFGFVPVFGKGSFKQQPIYIDELVDYFIKIIFSQINNIILELGGLEQLSYLEMIKCIGNVLNKNILPLKISKNLALFALKLMELLRIPFSIRSEQIYATNEDLICQNDINLNVFGVKQSEFKENLRKYSSVCIKKYK